MISETVKNVSVIHGLPCGIRYRPRNRIHSKRISAVSLKRYEYHHAKKRNSQYDLSLEELEECISKEQNVENQIELRELKWIIAKFIEELPKEKRILFLRRYWFLQSVSEMARDYEITPKNMSVKLLRIRKELKEYLKEEGFEI